MGSLKHDGINTPLIERFRTGTLTSGWSLFELSSECTVRQSAILTQRSRTPSWTPNEAIERSVSITRLLADV